MPIQKSHPSRLPSPPGASRTLLGESHAHRKESGFTLVELLVVILIVGILSSIAILAFQNQRNRANDTLVQSDMRNMQTVATDLLIDSGSYPRDLNSFTSNMQISEGTDYRLQVITDGPSQGFVVVGLHDYQYGAGTLWAISTWNGGQPVLLEMRPGRDVALGAGDNADHLSAWYQVESGGSVQEALSLPPATEFVGGRMFRWGQDIERAYTLRSF